MAGEESVESHACEKRRRILACVNFIGVGIEVDLFLGDAVGVVMRIVPICHFLDVFVFNAPRLLQ